MNRRRHPWPPAVSIRNGWVEQYAAEAEGLDVLPDVQVAIAWADNYIDQILHA